MIMMMRPVSGTKVIKNARLTEKAKIKESFVYCLEPRPCDGLVHVRRREEAVEVTDSCFKNYLIQTSRPQGIF